MNFDNLLTKMEISEMDGRIKDTVWALDRAMNNYPNATRKSVQIEDFVKNLRWVKDPQILMDFLDEYRVEPNDENRKDFLNRKVLTILGEYVEDEEFWLIICMKYPSYAKFYKKASQVFKTAIRIVT